MSVRIIAKVIDQVAPTHIQHRACRDDCTEAHLLTLAPVEDRGQQRSALAEKGDTPRSRHILGKGGVETDRRIHHAQAVGTDQAHSTTAQLILNLSFQFGALGPSFSKPCGNHNC